MLNAGSLGNELASQHRLHLHSTFGLINLTKHAQVISFCPPVLLLTTPPPPPPPPSSDRENYAICIVLYDESIAISFCFFLLKLKKNGGLIAERMM